MDPTNIMNPADLRNLMNQRRARFDELVAQQPEVIRTTIQQILDLPRFRREGLYHIAMRTPDVFILFVASQLTQARREAGGTAVWAVGCQTPNYANPNESLDRDFYQLRAAFAVHLKFHGQDNNAAYAFLTFCPLGADTGHEMITVTQAYERSALGNGDDRTDRTNPDLIRLLRRAIPDELAMAERLEIILTVAGFLHFASAFLSLAEHASPGIYAMFLESRDSASSFLFSTRDMYTGVHLPVQGAQIDPQIHQNVRREILRVMSDLGDLGTQVIGQFRCAPTLEDLNRGNLARGVLELPPAVNRQFVDLYGALASRWNAGQFRTWWESVYPSSEAPLADIDSAELGQIEGDLFAILGGLLGDGMLHVRRADYVDVEVVVHQKSYYDDAPRQTTSVSSKAEGSRRSSSSLSSNSSSERCQACTKILGEPRPRREPVYTLPCCNALYGIDCLYRWVEEKKKKDDKGKTGVPTCPLCRELLTLPAFSNPGFTSGSDSSSENGASDEPAATAAPTAPATPAEPQSPWPTGTPPNIDEPHNWFANIFVPAAEAEYEARHDNNNTQALREWLLREIRPRVQQSLLQQPAENGGEVPLTRIINL